MVGPFLGSLNILTWLTSLTVQDRLWHYPIFQKWKWKFTRLKNFPKVTELAWICIQASWVRGNLYNHHTLLLYCNSCQWLTTSSRAHGKLFFFIWNLHQIGYIFQFSFYKRGNWILQRLSQMSTVRLLILIFKHISKSQY